jgi:hypothetical protein
MNRHFFAAHFGTLSLGNSIFSRGNFGALASWKSTISQTLNALFVTPLKTKTLAEGLLRCSCE